MTSCRGKLREPDGALRQGTGFQVERDVRVGDIVVVDVEQRRKIGRLRAPDDCVTHLMRSCRLDNTAGSISGRSSEISPAPKSVAASPCSHTAAAAAEKES